MYLGGDGLKVLKVILDPAEFLEEEMHVDHVGQDQEAGHGREQVPGGPHLVEEGVMQGNHYE